MNEDNNYMFANSHVRAKYDSRHGIHNIYLSGGEKLFFSEGQIGKLSEKNLEELSEEFSFGGDEPFLSEKELMEVYYVLQKTARENPQIIEESA